MHRLSIITVNLNNSSGLRKTIESVVSQTYKAIEYLVIDGGSTDGSVDAIKEFSTKINYWVSEPDNGIYQAMNKGILKATGEYCQFLNSGDCLVAPDVVEKMLTNLPETSIVIGNMIKPQSKHKLARDKGTGFEKPTFLTFYRGTINHSPAYIKRSLFGKYGLYDENLRIVSDWKWYLLTVALNNEPVAYRDIDVTIFDMSGISNFDPERERKERRKVLEELVPANVLADYDRYANTIFQINRINRYLITRRLVWLLERVLFQFEKWKILF